MIRPSRIVTALIEPIAAKDLLPMRSALRAMTASHAPGTAPPDYDHPITKAMVNQLPKMTYGDLEAARDLLMKDDGRWLTKARERDGWLRLVNAELQERDRIRELDGDSLIDFLTKGARP